MGSNKKTTTCKLSTLEIHATARIIIQIIFMTLCSLITLTERRNPTNPCRSYSHNLLIAIAIAPAFVRVKKPYKSRSYSRNLFLNHFISNSRFCKVSHGFTGLCNFVKPLIVKSRNLRNWLKISKSVRLFRSYWPLGILFHILQLFLHTVQVQWKWSCKKFYLTVMILLSQHK